MLAEVIGVTVKMKWGVDPTPTSLHLCARVPLPAACGCVLDVQHRPTGEGPV